MKRRKFVASSLAAGTSLAASTRVFAQTNAGTATSTSGGDAMTATDHQSGYAPVNGLKMYYELHGAPADGQPPLVVLPGGFMTTELMAPLISALAATRRVVAVDPQGHGRTADVDRPLGFEAMADDVAALLRHLQIDRADVYGWSLGGGTAWQAAVRHPALVRKLVAASAPGRRDGWYPEVLAGMASLTPEGMAQTPYYDAYRAVAPEPDHWPGLVAKVRDLLGRDYDWSAAIQAIAAPTLIVVGDGDSVRPEHAVEMLRLRGGGLPGDFGPLAASQLAILPGTAHSALGARADLPPIVAAFLDAPMPAAG